MISSQDIYQRYVSERRTREIEGFRIECFPKLVRYTALRPNLDGFVTFANLSTAEADRFIEEQIGYFDTIGQHFEWKIYDFDEPAQLRAMLQARDFVNGQEEAFMVMPLPLTGAVMPGAGPDIRVQRIQDPIALRDVVSVQEQVWQRDFGWLLATLTEALGSRPNELSVYCAYANGRAVGTGWVEFVPNSDFADLHGGAVVADQRGSGIYSLLFNERRREAERRGYQYLAVDAAPMSRPILERKGFRYVCGTCPMANKPA